MGEKFHTLSLGQGQAPIATRLIKDGVKQVIVKTIKNNSNNSKN